VNLNFVSLYGGSWFPFGEQNDFVAQMAGFFDVLNDGTYTFSTTSDDGSWLVIDGSMVVNNGFLQGLTQRTGSVFLTAGRHPFGLQYFQAHGGAGLDLGVPAGVTLEPLPEPGTWGVAALALALFGGVRRRNRHLSGTPGGQHAVRSIARKEPARNPRAPFVSL